MNFRKYMTVFEDVWFAQNLHLSHAEIFIERWSIARLTYMLCQIWTLGINIIPKVNQKKEEKYNQTLASG